MVATASTTPIDAIDSRMLDALTRIAVHGAGEIRRNLASQARRKEDGSPVTDADEAANAAIVAGLGALLPGLPVVSEETKLRPSGRLDDFILVDPLDGTTEFVAGRDEYTVNIAVIRARTPVAGVIVAPAHGLIWRGVVGSGADRLSFAIDAAGAARLGEPEPIATRRAPTGRLVVAVSRSHPDPATDALIIRLGPTDRLTCGSSLKLCRLAEGAVDVCPRLVSLSEWDIAAGHALVVAAGGAVVAASGEALSYGHAERGFRLPGFIAWGDPARAGACR